MSTPDLSYIIPELRQFAVPIESLVVDPNNANTHDEKNMTAIVKSLDTFGQRLPLIVDKTTRVIEAGNGRYVAAEQLGWTHIAVLLCDDTSAMAAAFGLADNRTGELATWDVEKLSFLLKELGSLSDIESDLLVGFDENDLATFSSMCDADDLFTVEPLVGIDRARAALSKEIHEEYSYAVVIDCDSEVDQLKLLERFEKEELPCRGLML